MKTKNEQKNLYTKRIALFICGIYFLLSLNHILSLFHLQAVKREYCIWPKAIYEPLYFYGEYVKVPVLGYLHRPDCWIWFLTYFLFWSIYRKRKEAGLTSAIPFMYLATCYLDPISVLRYIYCLVVIVPLIGYVVMRSTKNRIGKSEE